MGGELTQRKARKIRTLRNRRGFTLLEVAIASVILVVGLVGILGLFTSALGRMASAQEELIARQKAREALESIFAARNSSQITFDQINNSLNGGIFMDGFQPLYRPGADAIIGTADDSSDPLGLDYVETPGPDGILGTGDDVKRPLSEFQRKIQISQVLKQDGSVNQDLRQIDVTITYRTSPQGIQTYVTSCYISRFR
jgi:prepilin-type N-terminal cleavage/methylation domain-containing protein